MRTLLKLLMEMLSFGPRPWRPSSVVVDIMVSLLLGTLAIIKKCCFLYNIINSCYNSYIGSHRPVYNVK